MLKLHMHTLGHKWHEGAAQMPHHIHMQLPWPPTINIAMFHQVRMRAITEPLDPAGMLTIAPRGIHLKYNLLFPLPGQGGDKSKLYFWGCGNPFLHLSVNLERQSAPTEPR